MVRRLDGHHASHSPHFGLDGQTILGIDLLTLPPSRRAGVAPWSDGKERGSLKGRTYVGHLRAVPDEFNFEPEPPKLKGASDTQSAAHKSWLKHPTLPEDFYLATDLQSQDKHGHGEATYIKVPPEAKGQVARLVEDPRTPYRSSGDVYRHALMHLLRDIENGGLTGDSYTDQVKRILTKARAETRRIETLADEDMVSAAGQAIEVAMRTKNLRALSRAVEEARQTVDTAESDVSSLERLIDGAVRELER